MRLEPVSTWEPRAERSSIVPAPTPGLATEPAAQASDPQPSLGRPSEDVSSDVMAWCTGSRTPAILAGLDGGVLWCNEAALGVLADRDHFYVRAGKLTCVDPAKEAAFRNFMEQDGGDVATWVSEGDASILILVREAIAGAEPRLGLTFHPAAAEAPCVWADFGSVMGLTSSEARIAQKLIEGGRADAIARDVGVGLETVRTHIRRIYNKLGVGSREELFSRLSPFRLR